MTTEPDAWLLDDKEVKLGGWHASFDERGCLRAGGRVTAEVAYRAEQGAPLTAVVNDEPKWDGTVSRPPLVDRGQAQLEAQGHRKDAEKATTELLYQTLGASLFFDRAGPPLHNLEAAVLSLSLEADRLLWQENQGAAATGGGVDSRSAAFWTKSPGGITRVAFKHKATFASQRQYEVYKTNDFPADTGYVGVTPFFAESLTEQERDTGPISSPMSGILIQRKYTGGAGTYAEHRAHVYDIRVNGIAPGDEFFTSDVVKDAGRRLGCDVSKVQSSSLNALPFYFQTGNWMDGVFVYVAQLDDWAPPFFGSDLGSGCELRYAPWGSVVLPVSLARDVRPDLVSLELYNRVTVTYPHVGGFTQPVTVTPEEISEADPLATYGIVNELPHIHLRDPQPDDTLARAVGENALRRRIRPLHQGHLEAASIPGATLWDALPGHHAELTDAGPMMAMELPISSLELAQGRPAQLGIQAPATEVGLEDIAALEALRSPGVPELVPPEQTAPSGPNF